MRDGTKLMVKTTGGNYVVHWSFTPEGFHKNVRSISDKARGMQVVVTSRSLAKIYGNDIRQLWPEARLLMVRDGESVKSLRSVEVLANQLVAWGADRHTTLWAFGGGVIGDLTGFLASVYLRGVDFIQVPTTLLSMVDSSVGGKTGVNLPGGKNLIGSFYQPRAVLIALPLLNTLSEREFRCGVTEAVKAALIRDPAFWAWIEDNLTAIANREMSAIARLSYESIRIKAEVVSRDEKETGLRAILNFGHTLAHALEADSGFRMLHGEAVSVGMHFAVRFSERRGYLPQSKANDIIEAMSALGLQLHTYGIRSRIFRSERIRKLVSAMSSDKKNQNGEIRFVFLKAPGKAYPEPMVVSRDEMTAALTDFATKP